MPRWLFVILFVMVSLALLSMVAFVSLPWILQFSRYRVGTVLVYEIEGIKPSQNPSELAAKAANVLDRRLNDVIQCARVRVIEGNRIEVGVYGNDPADVKDVAAIVECNGTLEFRIVANVYKHKTEIERARGEPEKSIFYDSKGEWSARWYPVADGEEFDPQFNLTRTRSVSGKEITEILVVRDPYDVTGEFIASAHPTYDNGKQSVAFQFTPNGGRLFGMLTTDNAPDSAHPDLKSQLAIILDDEVTSAPNILTTITDRAQITGNFTTREVKQIASCLNAGTLPVRLRRVGERKAEAK